MDSTQEEYLEVSLKDKQTMLQERDWLVLKYEMVFLRENICCIKKQASEEATEGAIVVDEGACHSDNP